MRLAAAVLVLSACATSPWPSLGQADLSAPVPGPPGHSEFLETGSASFFDPSGIALKPGVEMKHYPQVTVNGHFGASGTFVFYLKDRNVFYLAGDCGMDHQDDPLGPYPGHPRFRLHDLWRKPR